MAGEGGRQIPMITTLIFDLDETLLYEEASVEATFETTCAHVQRRYGIDPEVMKGTIRSTSRALWRKGPVHDYCLAVCISSPEGLAGTFKGDDPNLKALHDWVPDFRWTSWTQALEKLGIDDEDFGRELANIFVRERRKRHIVFPETESVLKDLHRIYRLAMITNGAPDVQLEKLNMPGLERFFNPVVVSGQIGISKPARDIFTYTLNQMKIEPETAMMIGDNPVNDVQGAQQCGIKGVWLNRFGATCPEGITPDVEINTLEELLLID